MRQSDQVVCRSVGPDDLPKPFRIPAVEPTHRLGVSEEISKCLVVDPRSALCTFDRHVLERFDEVKEAPRSVSV
jgi:hypothetical protein